MPPEETPKKKEAPKSTPPITPFKQEVPKTINADGAISDSNPIPTPEPVAAAPTAEAPKQETTKTETVSKEESAEKPKEKLHEGGESVLSRIRTYQDTVQDALRSQSMSSAKVLMAEQRRREERKIDEENSSFSTPRNKVFVGAAIGLIVIAVIVLFITFITKPSIDPLTGPKNVLNSMFFEPSGVIEVSSAQLSRNTILKLQQVLSSPLPKQTVQQVILTKEAIANPDSALRLTKTVAYQTPDILALIEARASGTLRESLNENYFLGVRSTTDNEPFLIFKVEKFDNVFAGMFQWEHTLVKDMEPIFFKQLSLLNQATAPVVQQPVFSTSTNGGQVAELPQKTTFNTRKFSDLVIGNTDARIMQNQNGELIFFYTFIDDDYLFFGTTPRTFLEVRKMLRSARLVL